MQESSNPYDYINKVYEYLFTNGFDVKRDLAIANQQVDLFGIKEIKRGGYPIQQSCAIQRKENANVNDLDQFSKENLEFASSALKSEVPYPVIIAYPVIVSSAFSDELIQKVMKFKPDPSNRWGVKRALYPKLSHPVLVNVSNKKIYHNDGYIIGIQGYRRIFNQFVFEALSF